MPVTLTIDLEDPSDGYAPEGRYVLMTRRILHLCDELDCKATFFTVGRVAAAAPHLIREIAKRGHEIAYHSHNHVSLPRETPDRLRQESRDDKDRLQQLSGTAVIGYRAPRFSLTPQCLWALDILAELGFRYSSSIMPTGVSLYGFPDTPCTPFAWPNGMTEFPLPVAALGTYRLPYLGGIYLYTMPQFLLHSFMAKASQQEILWTYAHPYDFDREERFRRMAKTPLWINMILWLARRRAENSIRGVMRLGAAPPLSKRIPDSPPALALTEA